MILLSVISSLQFNIVYVIVIVIVIVPLLPRGSELPYHHQFGNWTDVSRDEFISVVIAGHVGWRCGTFANKRWCAECSLGVSLTDVTLATDEDRLMGILLLTEVTDTCI